MKKYCWIIGLAILPVLVGLGCGELGKVDQGRTIGFDKAKWTVTLIRDVKADPQNPDYSHLPTITYALPADPSEMGPDPKPGLRLKLDTKNKEIVIFDPATQTFKNIKYTLIDQKEKVAPDDPSLLDKGKPVKFPVVNREKKTITLYSKRQQILTTFSVPDEYFAMPDHTWDAGDEARIYYKEEGKARRFMNITKTDIFKK
ncbi:MAG: DUF4881 domain-containing protein [Desulfobacca sp.]|nr:DUF4881 domain-containing protein [Desulfobacca sp.]